MSYFRTNTEELYEHSLEQHGATSKAIFSPEHLHASRIRRAAELINKYAYDGSTVLDVGCAFGALLLQLKPGILYAGLDLDPKFIEHCKAKFPHVPFFLGAIPLDPDRQLGPFDYVAAVGVAPHLLPGVAPLHLLARDLRKMATKGLIVDFHVDGRYGGKFSSHSEQTIFDAFGHATDCRSDENDSVITYFFRP